MHVSSTLEVVHQHLDPDAEQSQTGSKNIHLVADHCLKDLQHLRSLGLEVAQCHSELLAVIGLAA